MHRSPGLSVIPQLKIPMIGFCLHQWKGSVHQPRLVTCLDEFAPIGFKLASGILQFPIFCHRPFGTSFHVRNSFCSFISLGYSALKETWRLAAPQQCYFYARIISLAHGISGNGYSQSKLNRRSDRFLMLVDDAKPRMSQGPPPHEPGNRMFLQV